MAVWYNIENGEGRSVLNDVACAAALVALVVCTAVTSEDETEHVIDDVSASELPTKEECREAVAAALVTVGSRVEKLDDIPDAAIWKPNEYWNIEGLESREIVMPYAANPGFGTGFQEYFPSPLLIPAL